MHLIISQGNRIADQENVSSALVAYLYNLANTNQLDNNSNLEGNLYVPGTYLAYIDKLTTDYTDLHITAGKIYVPFTDPEFGRIMMLYVSSDGIGVSTADLDGITTINRNGSGLAQDIGTAFVSNNTITSGIDLLKLHNLTALSKDLFLSCSNLTEIGIPASVTSIGLLVCMNSGLNKVVVENIDSFCGISSLSTNIFEFGSGCDLYTILNGEQTKVTELTLSRNLTVNNLFRKCKSLQSVITSDGVTAIKDTTFYKCPNIQSVTLSPSTTSINSSAFYECNNLSKITGLNYVTSFGNLALYNAKLNLNNFSEISDAISFGYDAFRGVLMLGEIYLPKITNSTFGSYVFNNAKNITKVKCLGKLTTIPLTTFSMLWVSDDTLLSEVYLPKECTTIGYGAFSTCKQLSTIKQYTDSVDDWVEGTDPSYGSTSGLTTIETLAFYLCILLTNIDLSNVTTIGDIAFSHSGISSINAQSLTSIGDGAFSYCSSLAGELTFNSLSSLGGSAFRDTNITKFDARNSTFTRIQGYVFANCSNLREIRFPNTVTYIGEKWLDNVGYNSGSNPVVQMMITGLENVSSHYTYNWSLGNHYIVNPLYFKYLDSFFVYANGAGNVSNTTSYANSLFFPNMSKTPGSSINFYGTPCNTPFAYLAQNRSDRRCAIGLLYLKEIQHFNAYTFYQTDITNLVINNTTPPDIINEEDDEIKSLSEYSSWLNTLFPTGVGGAPTIGTLWVPDSAVATYQADPLYSGLTIKGINTKTNGTDYDLPRFATFADWETAYNTTKANNLPAPIGLVEEYMQ